MKLTRIFATALAVVLALPVASAAQQSDADQILAKATVIGALNISAVRDLDFGTILGGTTVTVAVTEPGAGKFAATAQANAAIQYAFTQIPTELTRVGGSETIPLTLTARTGSSDDPTAGDDVQVSATPVGATFPASGQGFVWIGGTITPAVDQVVGDYEATIEVSASYVSN